MRALGFAFLVLNVLMAAANWFAYLALDTHPVFNLVVGTVNAGVAMFLFFVLVVEDS